VNFGISSSSKFYINLVLHFLKMYGFSPSYQMLLNSSDILNVYYDNI